MTEPARYQSVFRSNLFAGRVVIVTGGGSGIGRCTAHELATLGAHVVITGRSPEKLEAVAREIRDDGGVVSTRSFDIRDEAAVEENVAGILREAGPVYGLVNNAGGQFPSPLAGISKKGFEAVLATNLTGGFLMARALYVQCLAERGGAIVNVTADFRDGMPGLGHSGAARAGMDNLTKTAAVEWARDGVRVNAVAPGWVASSGLDSYEDPAVRALIPRLKDGVPLKRLATEAEISAVICFLLCDAAAFITGATVPIDGGARLWRASYPLPPARNVPRFQGFHRYRAPAVLEQKVNPETRS